jgi:hypothetical protein
MLSLVAGAFACGWATTTRSITELSIFLLFQHSVLETEGERHESFRSQASGLVRLPRASSFITYDHAKDPFIPCLPDTMHDPLPSFTH